MENTLITKRLNAEQLQNHQQVTVNKEDVGFFLFEEGDIQTLLPGNHRITKASRTRFFLSLPRQVKYNGVVGAGGVSLPCKRVLGGWGTFQCTLLNARRFFTQHKIHLLQGQSPEKILLHEMQSTLLTAFQQVTNLPATKREEMAFWQTAEMQLSNTLLSSGWQLCDFQPMHLHVSEETRI